MRTSRPGRSLDPGQAVQACAGAEAARSSPGRRVDCGRRGVGNREVGPEWATRVHGVSGRGPRDRRAGVPRYLCAVRPRHQYHVRGAVPTVEEFAGRIRTTRRDANLLPRHPDRSDRSPAMLRHTVRPRAAYRWAAEVTVLLGAGYRGPRGRAAHLRGAIRTPVPPGLPGSGRWRHAPNEGQRPVCTGQWIRAGRRLSRIGMEAGRLARRSLVRDGALPPTEDAPAEPLNR